MYNCTIVVQYSGSGAYRDCCLSSLGKTLKFDICSLCLMDHQKKEVKKGGFKKRVHDGTEV